jgi:predicted PurR-regulated permease PerM
MNCRDKILIWLLSLTFICFFIYMISGILLPFVVAIITAYFLDPAADKLQKWGASRTLATITITGSFFLFVIIMAILLVPLLYDQLISLLNKVPEYINMLNTKLLPSVSSFLSHIDDQTIEGAKSSISNVSGYILGFLTKLVSNIWSSGLALVNLVSLVFVTPVVTFYMLRDWDKVVKKVKSLLPPVIREQSKEIDRTLSGYIRGQTNVCLLLGTFYAFGLTFAGLEFGFFIGMATGILSFIPYVGMLIGFVFGMIIAFFQFGDWVNIAIVAAVFAAGQVLEGNFITPKLVGDRVGLHPVWIIFGMLAGAALFGFVGILLAVPLTAIIGVLIKFILQEYLKSPIYLEKIITKSSKA